MDDRPRKIIHLDRDAFYAAVEQRDHPQYRNKPIIVGGRPDSRGVVATCSYEARQFGVRSAMPSAHAYRLCPQAIFVKPRFDAYREASAIVRDVFARYCDSIEPLSLDEAYLDVSDSELYQGSATLLAKQIKQDILQQTRLIASAGISYNKFLAKLASDMGKPDGLYLITPEQGPEFAEQLDIGRFHGIGPATEQKMRDLGINTGKDLKAVPLPVLHQHFGKAARHYFDIARGIDLRPVKADRPRKSVGVETTFEQDLADIDAIQRQLQDLMRTALQRLAEKRLNAYTWTVKIKFHNFVQITRSRTLNEPIADNPACALLLTELIKNTPVGSSKVRLLGVTLSALDNEAPHLKPYRQLDLFDYS